MAGRRVQMARSAGLAAALCLVALGPAAIAKPGGSQASTAAQPVEIARLRYRQGVEAYQAHRYREAIDYFLEADRLSPSAVLSYNIARAYENTNDAPATLRWYRDYLRRDPNAADRADVEGVIHTFEKRLAEKGIQQITVTSEPSESEVEIDGKVLGVTPLTTEVPPGKHALVLHHPAYADLVKDIEVPADQATDLVFTLEVAAETAPAPPPTTAPPPPSPADTGKSERSGQRKLFRTLGWVGIGTGGAALGGSLVFELLRRGAESDAKSDRTQVSYAAHMDTMEGRQTAARVLLGAGLVLGAAGGVLLWLGRDTTHTSVGLACVPGGCLSSVRGKF